MSARSIAAETWLAGLVVLVVLMMVLPLPTALLDLLLVANLAVSLLLLLSAISARSPLALSSLPTLLLVTTLFRLALNVSSTRLILLQADAGRVIESFGDFVVRGNYAVGAIVFLVLTIVQYVVIARGSERVAEVAARFALDALPGRQMAIDAELRAGALTADEARRRRTDLSRESSLYGALDGAMKFVKGDAIAGIVILVVNLVGGVGIGVGLHGLEIGQSLRTYALLTIGDGLVTQIPSLLVSTAAGVVVTRVASAEVDGSLGADIASQMLGSPRALGLAAIALAALAIVPGMPALPFLVLALALGGLAYLATRAIGRAEAPSAPLVVEVPATLLRERDLPAQLARAVSSAEAELGVTLPSHRAQSISEGQAIRVRIDGLISAERALAPGADVVAALADALVVAVRRDVRLAVGPDQVGAMIDQLGRERPMLVRQNVPRPLTPAALTEVVRALVAEGIPPRPFATVVETAAGAEPSHRVEAVRAALSRAITAQLAPSGSLEVIELDAMLEDSLRDGITRTSSSVHLALAPAVARETIAALRRATDTTTSRVVIVSAELRPHLRALVAADLPDLRVLSARELEARTELRTVARATV